MKKVFKKDITNLAKLLATANQAVWDAICAVEELVQHPIINDAIRNPSENEDFLKRLYREFQKLPAKNDEEFADPELNASYFQDFEILTNLLDNISNTFEFKRL